MSDETPRLRLKPKLATDASIAAPAPMTPAAPPISTIAPPPPPPAPPSPLTPLPPVATAVPPVLTAPVARSNPAPIAAAPSPRSSKTIQRVALGIGMAGIFIFSSAGYIAYRNLSETDDAEEQMDELREEPAAPSTVSAAATPATPAPELAQGSPSADSPVAPRADTAAPAIVDGDSTVRQWVNTVKISGTRSGRSPKVLIGGKTYSAGETVHAELGITFDDYDAGRHLVRFKDRSGARYERRVR